MTTKKIKKAHISAIALCPYPKNPNTWASLIKKSFNPDTNTDIADKSGMLVCFTAGNGKICIMNDGNMIIESQT